MNEISTNNTERIKRIDNNIKENENGESKRPLTPKKKSKDIKLVPFDSIEKESILEPRIMDSEEMQISLSDMEGLQSIYESFFITLWELDYGIMAFFCSKIGIPLPLPLSESNLPAPDRRGGDLIHPKKRPILVNRPYWQLFGAEFKANLSIMDLLFNEGPDSICYLK